MRLADAGETSRSLGEPAPEGLWIDGARVLRPATILASWIGAVEVAKVASLASDQGPWRLIGETGAAIGEAEIVCLACAMGISELIHGAELTPVRGQAQFARGPETARAILFGGYALPAAGGILFGATHDRGVLDAAPRLSDRRRNREAVSSVLPGLASVLEVADVEDWAAIRATTRDYLPLAGPAPGAPPGLFVLTGLGSRGFCLAPLLADHIAATALGRCSPLPSTLAALIDPERFAARAARRGRPATTSRPES
jgi:tRNA 5-methylaminomethyl-2-thiouridine biosynthesis bifunctional protein